MDLLHIISFISFLIIEHFFSKTMLNHLLLLHVQNKLSTFAYRNIIM